MDLPKDIIFEIMNKLPEQDYKNLAISINKEHLILEFENNPLYYPSIEIEIYYKELEEIKKNRAIMLAEFNE